MSTIRATALDFTATGTAILLGSGGGLINAVDITAWNNVAAPFPATIFEITDSLSAVLFRRDFISVSGFIDRCSLSGLNVPTSNAGGLTVSVTLGGVAGTQFLNCVVVYTQA